MRLRRVCCRGCEPDSPVGRGQVPGFASVAAPAFTLIELILLMALICIAVSMVTPRLSGFFRARAIDSEARQLLSLTRAGESRAAAEGIPMRLWVDSATRTYGLEAEPGYSDQDSKAEEFTLNESLQISVEENSDTTTPPANASSPAANNSSRAHAGLPAIRFLPAGGIDESSPRTVRLADSETGGNRALTLSRNRLQYEIQ